jgi:hypothetical protein
MKTYNIPFCNFGKLKKSLERINHRSQHPITLNVIGEITENRKNAIGCVYEQRCYQVELQGEPATISAAEGTWQMVAVLKPVFAVKDAELFVHEIPGQTCPIKYRKADLKVCDHCQTKRKRNSVYVMLSPSGEYFQVGRSCIKEFVGNINPDAILQKSEILLDADEMCEDASREKYEHIDSPEIDIDEFVAVVAVIIRREGWVPRKQSTDEVKATADVAWGICLCPDQEIAVENLWIAGEEDNTLAKEALAWARNLSNQIPDSYLYNLGVACRQESVTLRNAGYVASVVEAYKKTLAVTPKVLKHLGEIGERRDFENLRIVSTKNVEGDYGITTLVKFQDGEGNLLEWWASAGANIDWVEEGKPVNINAMVKDHKMFQGKPYTVLLRVKPT